MLFNYLKIAFRNMMRNKVYSFINISGLAVGLACFILIYMWTAHELSYDKFHEKSDRLYRIVEKQTYSDHIVPATSTPAILAPTLKKNYPEVVNAARMLNYDKFLISYKDKKFYHKNGKLVDPAFLDMFSFEFIAGDPNSIRNLSSILLQEDIAEMYFGDEDPIGKTVTLRGSVEMVVGGVYKKLPDNSHISAPVLINFEILKYFFDPAVFTDWSTNFLLTYVELDSETDANIFEKKIHGLIKENSEQSITDLYLQPLTEINLYPLFAGAPGSSFITYVYIFGSIAIFILLIACINFVNITTAKAGTRSKEVGIRKVNGAVKTDLIKQFFGESVVTAIIALLLAAGIVELLLPAFNEIARKNLALLGNLDLRLILVLSGIAVVTGILAGAYPAFYISSFRPVKVLREKVFSSKSGSGLRRGLVVFQFTLSIGLVICTLIISSQLDFIRNKNIGMMKENILFNDINEEMIQDFGSLVNELENKPEVISVSAAQTLPISVGYSISGVNWNGKDPESDVLFSFLEVFPHFFKTMGMELKEGRFFSEEYNDSLSVVVNEAALKIMGFEDDPVGRKLEVFGNSYNIVGVVNNFNFQRFTSSVQPLFVVQSYDNESFRGLFRIKGENPKKEIEVIKAAWERVYPAHPFEYSFLDERYDSMYRSEQRMQTLFGYFTGLAIIISCLGLFGLAAFMTEKQKKAIGIRKVLGARAGSLLLLLNKEFVILVSIANLIAWPVSYYLMSGWLQDFSYRIEINILTFIAAATLAFLIAGITVSYHTIKAAMTNPVKAIKYE